MKKKDILKIFLGGAKFVPGPVGMVAGGIDQLIKRDDNPSNDIEETAHALTDIVLNTIFAAEHMTHDMVNDDILKQIAANTEAQILFNIQMFRLLKARPVT